MLLIYLLTPDYISDKFDLSSELNGCLSYRGVLTLTWDCLNRRKQMKKKFLSLFEKEIHRENKKLMKYEINKNENKKRNMFCFTN